MKKKRLRPTREQWERWAQTQRLLEERVAILDRKIAEKAGREQQT